MIRAVHRSPLAVATASRGSVWWRLTALPTGRWLMTPSTAIENPADQVRATRARKHEEKNAHHFALLPLFVETYKASMGHHIVPKKFVLPRAEGSEAADLVPSSFTPMVGRESDLRAIPWPPDMLGLDLGRALYWFATKKKYQAEHPEVTAALTRMEFPLNRAYRKLQWRNQTMAALRAFHRIHGHTNVPADFIVPRGDTEWPVATWGYNLGARAERFRQDADKLVVSQLNDLDNVQLPPGEGKSRWIDRLQDRPRVEEVTKDEADLKQAEKGQLHVSREEKLQQMEKEEPKAPSKEKLTQVEKEDHQVPLEEKRSVQHKEKPKVTHEEKPKVPQNEKLALAPNKKHDAPRTDPLPRRKPWDFDGGKNHEGRCDGTVEGNDAENQWSQFVLPALETFYHVKRHSLVTLDFVVPSESPWPTKAWGLKLGVCVRNMRSRGDYAFQIKRDASQLSAIDFALDSSEFIWSQRMLPALTVFAHQHGHCDVSQSFVVPAESPWPPKTWGFALGAPINEVSTRERFFIQAERDAAQLEAIGLVRKPSEYRWSHVILPALETFFTTFHHCDIPISFVVPSSLPWLEEAWGLQLGHCVKHIWSSGAFAAYVERDAARLREIEFVERSIDYKWDNIILPALRTFAETYGHCHVPGPFFVPSESPWPAKAWGWRLGRVMHSIRGTTTYATQVKRDANELKAIGFHRRGRNKKGQRSGRNRRGEKHGGLSS